MGRHLPQRSTRDMSIPVNQSGPAAKAASSSKDQIARERNDMAMDVEGDGGGVGGKTIDSKKKCAEETVASDDEASGPACPLFMSGHPSVSLCDHHQLKTPSATYEQVCWVQ